MSETRTYRGGSLEELLPRIRAELGDDAVVVRQREGLTGGVAGFFQRRMVEIEARRGQSPLGVDWFATEPEEEVVVTPSPRFIAQDTPAAQAVPPQPAEQEREPESEVVAAAAPSAQTTFLSPTAEAPPAPPRPAPFAAYLSAAEALPEPAPSPAANGVPESVPSALAGDAFPNAEELMRDALRAHAAPSPAPEPIVTSPQVDAIPPSEPGRPEPPPSLAGRQPSRRDQIAAVARPQVARHLAGVLADRGLSAELATTLVDDALTHRLPLEPISTLGDAVAAQLAERIPVATLSGGAARTLVLAGAPGSGAPRLVAGIAAAYASRTTVDVACIALRTPDSGAALAGALAPLGVPVHAAADGAEAATHVRMLGHEALVVIDTAPVSVEDAGALAAELAALGEHELHLAVGPGGGPTAQALIRALRPKRLALGDPTDPLHLGAVLQAAIDAACPITFAAGAASAGRPDLAVHPADAPALARTLTA
jgi:flagellar biosynthesis GTPase FlhF